MHRSVLLVGALLVAIGLGLFSIKTLQYGIPVAATENLGPWQVELRISASEGSGLQIQADAEKQAQVSAWIKRIASESPSDTELAWAREVAIHRFDAVRAEIQALIWERDPQGTIQDLQTISAVHVSDVARIYF